MYRFFIYAELHSPLQYVFMIGGFSESPYMSQKISEFVEKAGLQAIRPSYP